jgi:hypothetical protein
LLGRVDEHGLGQVQLPGQRLEPLLRELPSVGEHRHAVALQRRVGEDVCDDVAEARQEAKYPRQVDA